jgi:hypothetical protein
MTKEHDYVGHFTKKYPGRVAIGVGYNEDLTDIYPIVFQNIYGDSIGIVALAAILDSDSYVYIYHIGAFELRCGNGSLILDELCDQADKFNVSLKVSAIVLPNGKDPEMTNVQLVKWYERFGFKEGPGLLRHPKTYYE